MTGSIRRGGAGRGTGRLWLVGITISISLSLKSDGRAYAQCSYPAFTYEIDILCKNIYTVHGGRRRGTHRCVLDNFDSGPHCRAEQSGAANPAWLQLPLAAAATSHPDPCAESRGPLKSLPFCGFVYFIAA